MEPTKENYRQMLMKWCEDTENSMKSVRDQLIKQVDKVNFLQWESNFFSFKKEVESEDSTTDENKLFVKSQVLYDKFKKFLEGISFRYEETFVAIGEHQLPALPYAYNALEPIISEETMRLHHLKHHQSYVDGLNKAELALKKERDTNNFDLVKHWERELAFNGSGHYLHSLFWKIMSPDGGGEPTGELLHAINQSFGSYEKFKHQFSMAAKNVEGSGWAILVWVPKTQRLEILTAEKHQNLTQWTTIPILALDVWEHAYYLQYKNDRGTYITNWWNIVNWPQVMYNFECAMHEKKD